jgi:hypothetical protein
LFCFFWIPLVVDLKWYIDDHVSCQSYTPPI